MTKKLKLRTTRIIVNFVLGIIILSLILSSMHSYIKKDSEKYIATINGEKINFKIFQNMYFLEIEKQKKILGKKFFKLNKNKLTQKIYNYVLSQLINNILLEQYTKKMKLQIDDNKAKKIILNSPIFQKNKKFNKEKYFNYLSSINLNNDEYINIIKKKIGTENLIHTIASTDFILENEKKRTIKLLSQKRIIKRSIFKIDSLISNQDVTINEAKNYFYKHKNNFYIPEKFKINFIQLKVNEFKTECNNKEIEEWYIKNIKKYSIQEKRRYSIIQIKKKSDALLILSQLKKKPEDFSKLAKQKSIDPISSKKEGDIGWISIDSVPNEIQNANLNQKNQISNVIPFRNEFLIVKLNEISLEKKKNINEVYDIIKKEIKNEKSLQLYNQLQQKISKMVKSKLNNFDLILKEGNFIIQDTDWFDIHSIPKKLNIPILKKTIFNKKYIKKRKTIKSNLNFFILKNNQSFLIKIIGFQKRKIADFRSVKNNVIETLKIKKAREETEIKSNQIISQLKKGNTELFKKLKLRFNNSEVISRYDDNSIAPIVFSLPHPKKGRRIYTLYKNKNKNFEIIFLKEIFNQDFSKEEKKIIVEYLEKNNIETIFNALLKNLRTNAIIKYEKIDSF